MNEQSCAGKYLTMKFQGENRILIYRSDYFHDTNTPTMFFFFFFTYVELIPECKFGKRCLVSRPSLHSISTIQIKLAITSRA